MKTPLGSLSLGQVFMFVFLPPLPGVSLASATRPMAAACWLVADQSLFASTVCVIRSYSRNFRFHTTWLTMECWYVPHNCLDFVVVVAGRKPLMFPLSFYWVMNIVIYVWTIRCLAVVRDPELLPFFL